MKLHSMVRVLTGDYQNQIGKVYDIADQGAAYPITVEFPDGTLNAYYESELEILESKL